MEGFYGSRDYGMVHVTGATSVYGVEIEMTIRGDRTLPTVLRERALGYPLQLPPFSYGWAVCMAFETHDRHSVTLAGSGPGEAI